MLSLCDLLHRFAAPLVNRFRAQQYLDFLLNEFPVGSKKMKAFGFENPDVFRSFPQRVSSIVLDHPLSGSSDLTLGQRGADTRLKMLL